MQSLFRVLVAENNPDDLFFLEGAFEQAEIVASVNYVRDGQELLDYLRGEPPFGNRVLYPFPTMVVLDLALPRIDGFRVLAWLRNEAGLQDLVLVVLSGSEVPEDLERAYGLGALEYIVKPSRPQDLVLVVRRLERLWRELNAEPALVAAKPAALSG
jgi:CheY-like chemotaxis protein